MHFHTDVPTHGSRRYWFFSSFVHGLVALVVALTMVYVLLVYMGSEPVTRASDITIRALLVDGGSLDPVTITYFPFGVDPNAPHLLQYPLFVGSRLTGPVLWPMLKGMFAVSIAAEAIAQTDVGRAIRQW
jgi:hypothetical protein